MDLRQNEYDYIVVGGGASGCVTAARLVSNGNRRMLLLEAGYSHHHPLLDMPPDIFKLINGSNTRANSRQSKLSNYYGSS